MLPKGVRWHQCNAFRGQGELDEALIKASCEGRQQTLRTLQHFKTDAPRKNALISMTSNSELWKTSPLKNALVVANGQVF